MSKQSIYVREENIMRARTCPSAKCNRRNASFGNKFAREEVGVQRARARVCARLFIQKTACRNLHHSHLIYHMSRHYV